MLFLEAKKQIETILITVWFIAANLMAEWLLARIGIQFDLTKSLKVK